MKKKYRAVLAALTIGMSICPLETRATPGQADKKFDPDISDIEEEMLSEEVSDKEKNELLEEKPELITDAEDLAEIEAIKADESEISPMTCLQIPQKLEVIIDPWELDGKGQIYSEVYAIRNRGEAAGILTVEFTCKVQKNENIVVKEDKEGLHDDESKSLYMELMFGDENRILLSQKGAKYQAELASEEELTVCFAGEVNENALESWKNGDFELEVIYSWNIVENMGEKGTEDIPQISETNEMGEEIVATGSNTSKRREDDEQLSNDKESRKKAAFSDGEDNGKEGESSYSEESSERISSDSKHFMDEKGESG